MEVNLTLGEILDLEKEINGFTNFETGEIIYHGILKLKLPIVLKYELTELGIELKKEKEIVEDLRNELIKKYGEESDDGIFVKLFDEVEDKDGNINRIFSKNYLSFDSEYKELLSKDKNIIFPDITKDQLINAGETTDVYKVIFKLIKKGS